MDWPDVAALAARAALEGAIRAAKREQRERQGDVLHAVARERAPYRDKPPGPPKTPSEAGKLGGEKRAAHERQRRHRALAAWSPDALLSLPNTVALFLRDNPMWQAWDWDATRDCNARLAHYVPQLYPDAPLPEDDRLALPLTAVGFMLWRALALITGPLWHVGPGTRQEVREGIYQEIREGVIILDRIHFDAYRRDDLAPPFREDFTAAVMAAEGGLMHFLYIGRESWRLIRECRLGRDCELQAPYFVNPEGGDPHRGCRVTRTRKERM